MHLSFCSSNNADTSPQIPVLILLSWEYKRSALPYSTDASEEGTKGRESARSFKFFEKLILTGGGGRKLAGFKNTRKRGRGGKS